jgi:hypothetical protein
MANPIIKRFRDDTGKVFEITEIIGDEVVISHEIHGEKVVLKRFIDEGLQDGEMFSRLTNVSHK